MDTFTSAKMMYTAVSMNEKQAEMKEKMKSTFRRGKRDKAKSLDEEDEKWGAVNVDELSGFKPSDALWKAGSVVAAAATVGTNLFTLATFGGPLHIVGATVSSGSAVTVAYRELVMDDIDSVRDANSLLRQKVIELAKDNNRLSGEVNRLEQSAFCLKETENRLKEVTGKQDLNVKNLVNLVKVNQDILDQKQKLVRQDVVADVVRVVLRADKDESGDFDKKEIRHLIRYIENLPSVKVNKKLLERALHKNKSVSSLIDIVNDLGRDDIPEKERIFSLNFADKKLASLLAEKKQQYEEETAQKKREKKEKKAREKQEKTEKNDSGNDENNIKPDASAAFDDTEEKAPTPEKKGRSLDIGDPPVERPKPASEKKSDNDEGEQASPNQSASKSTTRTGDLEAFLESPKARKSKVKSKSTTDESSEFSSTKKSKKKSKTKENLDDSISSEFSASKKSKKKSKSKTDPGDSASSELSLSKRTKKKSIKVDDSDSETSSTKRASVKPPTSKRKSKTPTRSGSSRSLKAEGSTASARPKLSKRSNSLQDINKPTRNLLASRASPLMKKDSPTTSDSTKEKTEKKKKGLLGFGLADKVKKRVTGQDSDSD